MEGLLPTLSYFFLSSISTLSLSIPSPAKGLHNPSSSRSDSNSRSRDFAITAGVFVRGLRADLADTSEDLGFIFIFMRGGFAFIRGSWK
ncbi:hypothetical protein [Luteolibacter soli]|uniref:Uncharacterized protein n=1 Tax=Luteolibacter soli TaxID=3135280 RepID=A0ABU9AW03_9BACT